MGETPGGSTETGESRVEGRLGRWQCKTEDQNSDSQNHVKKSGRFASSGDREVL